MITSDGSDFNPYTRTATGAESLSMTGSLAVATGIWPTWWLGSATGGGTTSGPGTGPQAGGRGNIAGISTTPIPVSWGSRRVNGAVIDKIVKPIGADGYGSEILCLSGGFPIFRDRPVELGKIIANGTEVWNFVAGVIHPAVASVVFYDGTSDAQIQDPTFVAEYGADFVPGYVGQMIVVIDYNTYAPWNGERPSHTLFINAGEGNVLFRPWGGTYDEDNKGSNITLSNGDLTADDGADIQSSVRGTRARLSGRYKYGIAADVVVGPFGTGLGYGIALCNAGANLELYMGSQDVNSFRWGGDGTIYQGGVLAGFWPGYDDGEEVFLYVDITNRLIWGSKDETAFYGSIGPLTAADVAAGIAGLDISGIPGALYPALTLADNDDKATGIFDQSFTYGDDTLTGMTNWGDVFVELAPLCNLDPLQIVINVWEESEGGVIYGGMSWSDAILNSGRLANIDYVEDFDQILVIQTEIEDPEPVIDEIPLNHRYVDDEDKGSTKAIRGGERRKPSVVELSYYDVSRQFQQSMIPARSEAHDSVTVERISTFWVMEASAAASRSAIALGKTEMEFQEFNHYLPPIVPYIQLRPIDIVEFAEESVTVRTKMKSWNLDTDWGVRIEYQFLFRSAVPEIPLSLEGVDPSLPRYTTTAIIDFSKRGNSGFVAVISGQ